MLSFGEWSSTRSFLSHFCLPTLLVFKLFAMPTEGTLNIELVSTDPQNVLPIRVFIFFLSCLVYSGREGGREGGKEGEGGLIIVWRPVYIT